jgi:hypothetical protein
MVNVNKVGIVLRKTLLDFECEGVLNPAAIKEGQEIHSSTELWLMGITLPLDIVDYHLPQWWNLEMIPLCFFRKMSMTLTA